MGGTITNRNNLFRTLGFAALLMAAGCEKSGVMNTSRILPLSQDKTSQTGQLALSVGEQITQEVLLSLKENGMNNTQIDTIRQGALAGLDTAGSAGLSLAGKVDANKVEDAAPAVLQGAIGALSHEGVGLADDQEKIKILGLMTKSVVKSLDKKMDNTAADIKNQIPGKIAQAAVSALDEGGISKEAISSGVETLMSEVVSGLDEAGYPPSDLKAVVGEVTKKSVEGLKDSGLEVGKSSAVIKAMMKSSVSALKNSGADQSKLGEIIGPMVKGAVSSFDELGLKSNQVANTMDDMMQGTFGAFNDIGLNNADAVKNIMGDTIGGAMSAMKDSGIESNHFADAMENMMQGAMKTLPEIGFKGADDFSAISEVMIHHAIDNVDEFKADASLIQKASSSMLSGMTRAMVDFQKDGIMSNDDFSRVNKGIQARSVDALRVHDEKFDLGVNIESMVFSGLMDGMAQGGMAADDIKGSMAFAGDQVVQNFVGRMRTDCEASRGKWHDANGGFCEYPQAAPLDGSVAGPPPEEEKRCFDQGGTMMFLPDGTFFCEGIAVNDRAACEAQGYHWIFGPQGFPECSPLPPVSKCDGFFDEPSCVDQGCAWQKDFCQEAAHIECFLLETEAECLGLPSCAWQDGICDNYMAIAEGGGGDYFPPPPGDPNMPPPPPPPPGDPDMPPPPTGDPNMPPPPPPGDPNMPPPDTTSPTAATNLHWTMNSPDPSGWVTAEWIPATSTDLTTQEITFFTDPNCTTGVASGPHSLGAGATTHLLSAVTVGTTYYYQVKSIDDAGNFSDSMCSPPMKSAILPGTITVANVHSYGGNTWLDWANSAGTGQCVAGTDQNCIHSASKKKVVVTGIDSCEGLSYNDQLDAFEWVCDDSGSFATFYSVDYKNGLEHLIDDTPDPPVYQNNSFTVYLGGQQISSTAGQWWSDNMAHANACTNFSPTNGKMYVIKANLTCTSMTQMNIAGERVGIVVFGGYKLQGSGTECGSSAGSICFTGPFGWFEGEFDNAGRKGVHVGGHYMTIRKARISDSAAGSPNVNFDYNTFGRILSSDIMNSGAEGIKLNAGSDHLLDTVGISGSSAEGLKIYNASATAVNHNIQFLRSTNNGSAGILVENSKQVRFQNIMSTNNGGINFYLNASNNNVVAGAVFGFSPSDGVKLSVSHNNILTGISSTNNGNNGFHIVNSTNNSLLSTVSMNNGWDGFSIITNSHNTALLATVGSNNGGDGLGVQGSNNLKVKGDLWIGGNSANNCNISGTGNDIDSSCTPQGGATFNPTIVNTVVPSPFMGYPGMKDPVNTSVGSNNTQSHALVYDWLQFENIFRTWGNGASPNFEDPGNQGRCTGGNCKIYDYSLDMHATGPYDLRFVHPCPMGTGDAYNHAWNGAGSVDFVMAAQEQIVGVSPLANQNGNGLCEAGEVCVATPNFGAYQGHGKLMKPMNCSNYSAGVITGVSFNQYELNGR